MTKITNTNILSAFRKQVGISKADEIAFAEAFQSIFEEALLRDKVLKISGLGTFKLIPVESRKSVNVNTGEEFEIASHYKLTFTPDPSLKDKVNEPLAHLETTELSSDIDIVDKETSEIADFSCDRDDNTLVDTFADNNFGVENPLQKLVEQAEELKGILKDIQSIGTSTQDEQNAQSVDNVKVDKLNMKETSENVNDEKENNKEIIEFNNSKENTEEESGMKIEDKKINELKDNNNELISAQDVIDKINNENGFSDKRSSLPWILVAIVLFIAIIVLLLYQNRSFFISNDSEKEGIETVVDTIMEGVIDNVNLEQEVAIDTLEQNLSQQEEDVIPEDAEKTSIYSDKFSDIFNRKREYVEFIDTIILNGGKRLTLVSFEFYGHKDYWVYIYEANRDVIKNPNTVRAGIKLVIPKLPEELIDAKNPETIEYARYLHDVYIKK
ncbi:MAG: HU family DNA-binding protein [Paludibacteraceae bacterium]|nr:HU family DNA-binding protein [Paludibacteraceae bacterium]